MAKLTLNEENSSSATKKKMPASLVLKRIVFYFLSFTWGILATLPGIIVILLAAPLGRVKVFHGRLYAVIGEGWGGVELGCFFVIGKDCDGCRAHETGHGLQNIIWGPLYIFVIGIPSAIRYWYREFIYATNYEKWKKLPNYDSIWFEGQATRWGEKYVVTDRI